MLISYVSEPSAPRRVSALHPQTILGVGRPNHCPALEGIADERRYWPSLLNELQRAAIRPVRPGRSNVLTDTGSSDPSGDTKMHQINARHVAAIAKYVVEKDARYEGARLANKVEVIKQFRELIGLGLKDSKDIIEIITDGTVSTDPLVAYLEGYLRGISEGQRISRLGDCRGREPFDQE
jgi:hypothetical protein